MDTLIIGAHAMNSKLRNGLRVVTISVDALHGTKSVELGVFEVPAPGTGLRLTAGPS